MAVHDCEVCGELCDCDGDDTFLSQPADCTHVCEDDGDEDWQSENHDPEAGPT